MNKNLILYVLLGSSLLSGLSCARKRPIERKVDTEGNRWAKADLEEGKPWLGKVTVVNNGSNSAFGFVGMQSDTTLGYFHFTKDHLQYLSLDDPFKGPNSSDRVINEWSIDHSDYTQKVSGGRVSNVETENDTMSWEKKRFFQINWDSAVISESGSFPFEIDENCWSKKASRLVDYSQEITNTSINFTIAVDYQVNPRCIDYPQYYRADFTHTMLYKYSFMQEPDSNYKAYIYTGENDPLMKKYGYFNSVISSLNELGRPANTFVMNRWNSTKTHTIYFTESFPEKYKWIYADPEKGVIAQTNKLFERNKIPLRFEIKKSDGSQKLGDIRYSFVHFIEESDFQAPFGYGPMSVHPRTGEILGTTTVVWISDLRYYMQRLKDYDTRQSNRVESSSIYREMKKIMGQDPSNWTASSSFLIEPKYAFLYRYLLPEYTYGSAGSPFARHDGQKADLMSANTRLASMRGQKPNNYAELDAMIGLSNSKINAELDAEEQRMSGKRGPAFSTVWRMNDAMFSGMGPVLQVADTEKAISDILYRVAIHEFGHNLNLRHNFYGSVDAGIDRSVQKDPKKLKTSSVMDYLSLKDEIGLDYNWEAYDEAALVYAYTDGAVDLPRQAGAAPYLYCTDEHVFQNPLCKQFDIGTSPSEILTSMIENYDDSYYLRNFRYGRAFWNTEAYSSSMFRTMWDVKRFVSLYKLSFTKDQNKSKTSRIPDLNPILPDAFSDAMANDLRQSVKLAAAFYAAIIKQNFIDRPFFDTYDDFTGTLNHLGIGYDKLFASRFFLGDDAFPLNPNNGNGPVSFIPLRDDLLIGSFIDKTLFDVYVNSGDMYQGFDDLGRSYFMLNAASNFDFGGGRGAIDLLRVACFRKASFAKAFNLNPDSVSINGAAAAPLNLGVINPSYNADSDAYFVDEPSVAVIRINSDFYVAGTSKNPYAAALIAKQDLNGILNSNRNFYLVTEGRIPECR